MPKLVLSIDLESHLRKADLCVGPMLRITGR